MTNQEFEAFYNRHWKYVYRLCYVYMKTADEAEDCTEDVFVKVLNGSFEFEDELHEHKWLTAVACNLCKDRLKSKAYKDVVPIEEDDDFEAPEPEDHSDVLEAVLELPDKYKEVVWLYYYDGLPTEKIAEMLKSPPSTIRNRLSDARKMLYTKLKEGNT